MPSLGYTKCEIPQELFILVMLVLVLLELTQQCYFGVFSAIS
jgi:hypothetical protein